ncbi:class I SAM-dependent methyltransferase [Phycicoccus sonneratiae]|uniref:Methyltransferase domain-containing protein n=1 Tax=Phycicoccus sonneratiae TaxID=2807628 RepID=A0ABS2CH59_9MICO|nr:class I SAM-dependent methyltransferase [Phycicoccus sonneraticus]MBM6399207.1 methyltransferase domain-containing protein [Phycicoccus sonneraticus]
MPVLGVRRWWDERALPRLTHRSCQGADVDRWRAPVCAAATGVVLDVGFGSGPNLEHYPAQVTRVLAAEPSDLAWELSGPRREAFGRPVERTTLDAADLSALADGSVDTVVTAWALCTVPEVETALAEARRVLRPGGALLFVEHSLAPDARTVRWQRRVQPVWGRVAGGCHVDRDLPAVIAAAGFAVDVERARAIAPGPLRAWGWFVSGTARPEESGRAG